MRNLRIILGGMCVSALLLAIGEASALAQTSAGGGLPSALGVESPLAGGPHEVFHTCKVIGEPVAGIEAVHCADLFETPVPGAAPSFVAENEVLCQTVPADTLLECAGIHEQPEIAFIDPLRGLFVGPGANGVCGVRFNHSPCGVRRVINASPAVQFVSSGRICDIWAVSLAPSVVLPRSGVTVNAPNLATPHTEANC